MRKSETTSEKKKALGGVESKIRTVPRQVWKVKAIWEKRRGAAARKVERGTFTPLIRGLSAESALETLWEARRATGKNCGGSVEGS